MFYRHDQDFIDAKFLAIKKGKLYVGICLNFNLAAQSNNINDLRKKLDSQVKSYIYDATQGEDSEHREYLLSRRAPIKYWVMYYFAKLLNKLCVNKNLKGKNQSHYLILA